MFPNANNRPQQTQKIGGQYPYNPYQVSSGDTFASIAANSGFTESQIQSANPGLTVPPPNGSFINLPQTPLSFADNLAVGKPTGPQQTQTIGGTQTPAPFYTGQQNAPGSYYQSEKLNGQSNPYSNGAPFGTLSTYKPPAPTMSVEQINQIVAQGGTPSFISAATPLIDPKTGKPVDPKVMQANGYIFSPQSNGWVLGPNGAAFGGSVIDTNPVSTGGSNLPGGTNSGGPKGSLDMIKTGIVPQGQTFERVKASEDLGGFYAQENTFLNAYRYDPTTGKTVKIKDLIKQGKLDITKTPEQIRRERAQARRRANRRSRVQEAQQVNQQEPTYGAGATPGQQLNTNQAGG